MISPIDFTIFLVKFANNLNNNDITVSSCRPKDIFNEWWCQTSPLKIFSERAAGEYSNFYLLKIEKLLVIQRQI